MCIIIILFDLVIYIYNNRNIWHSTTIFVLFRLFTFFLIYLFIMARLSHSLPLHGMCLLCRNGFGGGVGGRGFVVSLIAGKLKLVASTYSYVLFVILVFVVVVVLMLLLLLLVIVVVLLLSTFNME